MLQRFFLLGLICISLMDVEKAPAQVTDNTSTFKNISNKSYFRLQYDNDYFTKTDYYYSQGITLEYIHPSLKRFLLSKLLLKFKNSNSIYGISLNHFAYTPTSILSDSILYGDHPYGAAFTVKTFSAATDTLHKKRISSALNIGIIGPAALGKEIQVGIHTWLKNVLPHGWQYQIQNDVILNYQVNYEKMLRSAPGHFLLNGVSELRIGTLDDRLNAGFNFMTGNFNDPYQLPQKRKKVEYYFYSQGRMNFVGYDARLQGGLFNRKNPYIIPAGDIKRISLEAEAGIAVNFKKLFLSYSQAVITKEFSTGMYHRWGGINIGFSL